MTESKSTEISSQEELLNLLEQQSNRIAEQEQEIQNHLSSEQELNSQIATLQSTVTTLLSENEKLTKRAAVVNSIELKNRELSKATIMTKKLSAEVLQRAQQEQDKAKRAEERRRREEEEKQKEIQNRREAEKKQQQAETTSWSVKNTFKTLFIANAIFTGALAFFMLYDRRSVLWECGKWFTDRGKGIAGFASWVKDCFLGMAHGMAGWKWPLPVCYGLTGIVFLLIAAALVLLFMWLFRKLSDLKSEISSEYISPLFKGAISADIAIILFFVCLWFYSPIKATMHMNIFSLWLIFALVGVLVWNAPEVIRGTKRWIKP